ncbi:MAG: preprotein translocase subunit SecG [Ignavibacteria bacterium]
MYTLLVTGASVIAVFLIISVLLQSSKGGGLAGTFGGGGIGTMFGTRRTADFLSKASWWLAGILVVVILLINLFFLPGQIKSGGRESIIQKSRQNIPTSPALPAPATGQRKK